MFRALPRSRTATGTRRVVVPVTLTALTLGALTVVAPPAAAATGAPVADFDGDGTTDIGVFRDSAGRFMIEGGDWPFWGGTDDVNVSADYDGDGTTDVAVFRPATGQWFVQGVADTYWGGEGDIPVPADYDGDGTDDSAVFRPATGQWFVQDGESTYWGGAGDVAVPGDYDGDGTDDIAVFRPATGQWFVQDGESTYWGEAGDQPLAARPMQGVPAPAQPEEPADTVAPATPAGIGTVLGRNAVTVTWTAGGEADLAGYRVERSTPGTEPVVVSGEQPVPGTSFTDDTVTVGTGYTYTVTAIDASGNASERSAGASATPIEVDVVVAADGSGDATTVQGGIDLIANNADHRKDPKVVLVQPGTYTGLVNAGNRYGVTLTGATTDPTDAVLTASDAAVATVSLSGHEWSLKNLTVANTNGAGVTGALAVALKVSSGDKHVFDNVRFLGNKQTLQLSTANTTTFTRMYFTNAYIEGGQDIILGRAVAVFEDSTIHVLDQPGASITDSAVDAAHPYGFLITESTIDTDGSGIHLGRPYPAHATAQAQVTVRETELDAGINAAQPWKDWNATTPWTGARFSEYQNTGPGATINANRPQLTDEQAPQYTKAAYLAGTDGWNPTGQTLPTEPADTTAPAAPAGVTATGGDGAVEVSWTANNEADLAGYNLYRSTTSPVAVTAENRVNAAALSGTTYTDRAIVAGTEYFYVLTAVDQAGNESPVSSESSATPTGEVLPAHDILVAQDGSGDHTTVQAAVDAAGATGTAADPVVIAVEPGTYRELVSVTRNHIELIGTTGTATDVVLTYDNAAGTTNPATGTPYGTGGSQSVLIKGNDVTVRDLTIENAFDEAASSMTNEQAVALHTSGDRLVFENVRLLGNQDTLLVNSGDANIVARSYFVDSYVEGDVDFIFGRGTAVFERSTIHALSRGSSSNNGYLTAASTADSNPYGILITDSTVTSDAPANTFHLGRPWRGWSDDYTKNGVEMPNSRGQVTIRDTELPAAIKVDRPWTDMSPNLWTDGRFSEYGNTGPGATVNDNRPQLTAAEAADRTTWDYLAGSDGWNPTGTTEPDHGDVTAPAAPADLTASTDADGATLAWTASSEADLAGYHVYRATGGTVEATAANRLTTELLTDAAFTDGAVAPGVEYSYAVTAVDTAGNESPASAPVTVTSAGQALPAHDLLVAQDGSGDFATVQAAVDAAGTTGTAGDPVTIAIQPGTYREVVTMSRNHVELIGTTGNARDVVIVFDNAAGETKPDGSGTYGSSGSASVLIKGSNITVRNLTLENDFDEESAELTAEQALAVKTQGDRLVFDNVRVLGDQDTLMVDSPAKGVMARSYFVNSYVEGDVDFIFGRGTAVFDRSTIFASTRGSSSNNGYVTASSIDISLPYGILITDSTVESDAPAGTFHLGRPWHPSGDVDAIAQVVVRDTVLPAAIKSAPWTDMSGFSWTDARFSEYRNTGPGAGVNENRPQLTAAEAERYTKWDYLAGNDDWNPTGEEEPPPSDTTAPAAPAGLTATVAPGTVSLDWTDNGEADLAGYVVYRSLSEGGSYARLTGEVIPASSYSDATVPVGSTGYYRVTAVDSSGNESAPSTASATVTEASGETRPLNVFVIGDSTASTYQSNEAPRTGWGQTLDLFTTDDATVVNYAKSGASSKDYYDSGLFNRTLAEIQPGDYLLISFGHNDQKADDPTRHTDPYGTYQEYLQKYIDGARAAGATPVLVTSVERRRFDADGNAKTTHGEYPAAMTALGTEQGVAVIDLTAKSIALWNELGPEGTKEYFLHLEPGEHPNYPDGRVDDTHFQARGAIELARIVATAMAEQAVLPAGDYLERLTDEVADSEVVWPQKRPL